MLEEGLKRQWGKSEIKGGRHAFRVSLLVREIERMVPRGRLILDAGCGDGGLSLELSRRGYRVIAIDPAQESLCRVEDKHRSLRELKPRPPLPLVRGSLEALPLSRESVSAAAAGEVLEHLEDDRAAAGELYRVLLPGGLCFVSVPAEPKLWGIEDEWAGHKRRYTKEELQELMTSRGFKVERIYHWGWPLTYFYDRWLYRLWLERRLKKDKAEPGDSALSSSLVSGLLHFILSFDRLFLGVPRGIGLIGVFRKP